MKMKKAILTFTCAAAMSLALSIGASAQEKMETRDNRIAKLVFKNGYAGYPTYSQPCYEPGRGPDMGFWPSCTFGILRIRV
jgi:hypothetical protein